MSLLPLDLHIVVLSLLPAARCRFCEDVAIQTLLTYSQTTSLLREAALAPAVWESHYRMRYRHCISNNEDLRKSRHNGNWRLMYYQRRRVDKIALGLLRDITLSRVGRNEMALMLSKMGADIWDVLDIEAQREVPVFPSSPEPDPPYILTQRFWVRRMLEMIAREQAIEVWGSLSGRAGVPVERASFEKTMLGMSAFFGKSIQDMTELLDDLEAGCRRYVRVKNLTLDAGSPAYNIPELCKAICGFMLAQGFGPSQGIYLDILNQFPHAYLTTNKHTLPIALAHLFASLARRLGLDASPINFPEKVLCHVRSPREEEGPFYINVSVNHSENCIIRTQDLGHHLSTPQLLDTMPAGYISRYLEPADPSIMLLRAATNILVSFSRAPHLPYDVAQNCLYLTIVVYLMFHGDVAGIAQILRTVDLRPVDCATFLMDRLAPLLSPPSRILLETHCNYVLEDEAVAATSVQLRSQHRPVKYFVGLPFRHRRYGFTACITNWDEFCKASDAWINQMGVDALDKGRHQPFYTSLVLDEGGTQRYIGEENIEALPLSEDYIGQLFEKHPNMAMYFQSVEIEETDEPTREKRWRMVLSPESRKNYPEDEAIGSAWVKEGILLPVE